MERNFGRALELVLKHEGGWADHPDDPGGATMKGITLGTYRQEKPGATKTDLRNISDAEVERIYRERYSPVSTPGRMRGLRMDRQAQARQPCVLP